MSDIVVAQISVIRSCCYIRHNWCVTVIAYVVGTALDVKEKIPVHKCVHPGVKASDNFMGIFLGVLETVLCGKFGVFNTSFRKNQGFFRIFLRCKGYGLKMVAAVPVIAYPTYRCPP